MESDGKMKLSKLLTVFIVGFMTATMANAALDNATFVNGDNGVNVIDKVDGMQFDLNAGTTNLNWNKFNVGASETVNYNFNAANSTAINQINSIGGASVIAGKINAIGSGASTSNIIINNAAGVSFVNGSCINVGSMTVNSDKQISVNGLSIKDGNLFLNTTNGGIEVKGLIYTKKGDLYLKAKNGDIVLGGIKKANTLRAETNKNIIIKGDEYRIGNKTFSGITTENLQLATSNSGKISIDGSKITVGKDFVALTKGSFIDDANSYTGSDLHTIVTKHGEINCIGFGGNGSLDIVNSEIKQSNGVLKVFAKRTNIEGSTLKTLDAYDTTATIKGSKITNAGFERSVLTANNTNFGNLSHVGGTVTLTDSIANAINSQTSKTYADGTLVLNNSTVNDLNTINLFAVELNDSTVQNDSVVNTNWLTLNNSSLMMNNSKVANSILMTEGSSLIADTIQVNNCIDAKDSNLSLANSSVGHHLIIDDTNTSLLNTIVYQNVYLTSSTGNDFSTGDVQPFVNALKGWNSELYIGYAPSMGDYKGQPSALTENYAGNIDITVDMANRGLKMATTGNINLNVQRAGGVTITNSNNAIISAVGELKLNNVKASNDIKISAGSLKNNALSVIDSANGSVDMNVGNLLKIKQATDENGREFNVYQSNGTYNVYDVATIAPIAPVTPAEPASPVIPADSVVIGEPTIVAAAEPQDVTSVITREIDSTLNNYISSLKINAQNYDIQPVQSLTLASQFGRNVKSLAADDATSVQMGVLKPINNGFRVEKSFVPALNK